MTPTPQEVHVSNHEVEQKPELINHPILENEDIVISGMSGLYPKASNIKEFSDLLYSKTSPFSECGSRWDMEHPELPQYLGKCPKVETFDANFFTVNYRLADYMDPMSRKLLEHTYQAIYDAGLSPAHLSGKKVAVFVGCSLSDSEKNLYLGQSSFGLRIVGSSKTMFANRISYWLNVRGPSLSIDDADCSSSVALEKACTAIRQGECEAAIVGGVHLCLLPHSNIHHSRIGQVTKDSKVKSYSENSSGYILSDAINVLVLQKAKDALRNYAQILHIKNEYIVSKDKATSNSIYDRNFESTAKFIKEFYKEVAVVPQAVGYVEGYGTGIPDADKSELEALAEVYCKDRSNPLCVGSITSNIGLTEASAGIAGITKILLGYHKGEIAASLNCEQPRTDVPALRDGRMRVITEHQQFDSTYAAVNTMSVTGCNSHVLLCGHYKAKNLFQYTTSIPYLITLSGRQESSVENIFKDLKSRPLDAEEIALFHNIHSKDITGHLGRGFTILDTSEEKETVCITEKTEYFDGTKRPLWFVYSGMGSQWVGMGSKLMRIPIFAESIKRCHRALAPTGLDLIDIITTADEAVFDNILNSFVGIAAIQIALTDVLRALGLQPDGIIGHSVGEMGCAYADGCLSAEEMILAAHSRGKVSLTTKLIRGAMAAVGLGYQKISTICPPEIDVACRNSDESCTISGPADAVKNFVAQLSAKGIFAKEVQTANIAYHSRYIADAAPQLLQYLKSVIKTPKVRNERWISTSVPQAKWNEPSAKYCSAEYLTNNLMNPVLFEESCRLIPSNAVLIEVAPHGLLQAILKRSLSSDCCNISLTRRGHEDNAVHLLRALGDVYMAGFPLNTQVLYPKVEFPVSTKTPMLSHLVEWMHSEKWVIATHNAANKKIAAICNFAKSIHDNDYKYLQGHVIKNKMCYPLAAALVAAWDMFAIYAGLPKRNFPVIFNDIRFYAQPFLFYQKALRVTVSLFRGSFQFEVRSEHSKIATGCITGNIQPQKQLKDYKRNYTQNSSEDLTSESIYQLLNDRGYNYSGQFRSIEWANASLTQAAVKWCDNWVTFLDGMLQLNTLRQSHHNISPTFIRYLSIDTQDHSNDNMYELNGKFVMAVEIDADLDTTRSGGVFIKNIHYDKYLPEINLNLQEINLKVTSGAQNMINYTKVQQDDKFLTLTSKECGKLDTLHWVQNRKRPEHNNTVTVKFAGLNQLDVKQATGTVIYDINRTYGMDYSGITNNGERVMGIVSSGSVSSKVDAQFDLLWPVPNHWSLEDAATVPFAYAYAFYALVIKGSLCSGMTILIHEATEMIGQAAIRIALANKCQVFATVGDIRKKEFLQKLIPEFQEENIGNSNDINFSDKVLLATQGNGCDLIISCVKEELKNATIKCCASSGITIDISHIQDHEDFQLGLYHLTKSRSYITIDFTSLFTEYKNKDMKILQNLVSDGIADGYVVPLSRVTYRAQEAERAFKRLENSQLAGRVIIHISDKISEQAEHRTICDPDKCQIIFWNDEVFGCQVAETLIKLGAKKLFINCTTLTPYQLFKIRSWKESGVKVEIAREEFTKDLTYAKVLNKGLRLFGTIEGIYVILTASKEDKEELFTAIEKLDSISRLVCDQLKHFLVVSTVNALGRNVCLSRAKLGLASTWLDLSSICHDEKIEGGHNIGNVVESALCNENVTFVAEINQVKPPTLFDELIALGDIKIPQPVDMTMTLQELNLAEEKISLIHTILKVKCNIHLERSEVPLLTLEKIRELEESISDIIPENSKGISTFLSDPYSDEILGTVDLITLSTLSHRVVSVENNFDVTGEYLCIIPGIGGHYERFQLLCERLKLPAVVLQPGLDYPNETAKETALRYAKIINKKTHMQDTFYILGYESGVMVALELSALLESQGLTGKVFCLGCAPSDFQREVQYQLSEYVSEDQLQDAVISHIYTLLSGNQPEGLSNKLREVTSWTEKVDLCTRHLLGQMAHSAQFAKALLETTLARLIQAQENTVTVPKLRSKVVLMRSASALTPSDNTIVQQLSEQPVAVHHLQFPLSSVTTDMQCPAIINQYLDETVLKAFENNNTCEPYFIQY